MADQAHSWPSTLGALLEGRSLDPGTTAWAMDEIMSGNATAAQLASFAVLLRAKGETVAELNGLVATMLARATPVRVSGRCVDVVGTGGDRAHTVNISTMAAIVVAGSGRLVVKHGNRAASSTCGAADVLEELGVAIDLPASGVEATVAEVGIGFCFAPVFHPGMRHAGPPRREIGVPTVFNVLGPLSNPARPSASAIGCADARMAPVMAEVLAARGDTALVVRGDDGLDELTTTTTSQIWLAEGGVVRTVTLDPSRFGIAPVAAEALRGGDRIYNAQAVRDVLGGRGERLRDVVVLNAAAGIVAFDGTGGEQFEACFAAALDVARDAIDSGAAASLLERWVSASSGLKPA
jgi:anthranilate phosphoribosyltransferase